MKLGIRRRLTFANLTSAAALFIALSGGTALALSGSTGKAANVPATACNDRLVVVLVGEPDETVCTSGTLTLTARCVRTSDGYVDAVLLLDTSSDHAFETRTLGGEDIMASDPPRGLFSVSDALGQGPSVNNGESHTFTASERPAAGGRHLGGTVGIRAIRDDRDGVPVDRCQFAVEALTG